MNASRSLAEPYKPQPRTPAEHWNIWPVSIDLIEVGYFQLGEFGTAVLGVSLLFSTIVYLPSDCRGASGFERGCGLLAIRNLKSPAVMNWRKQAYLRYASFRGYHFPSFLRQYFARL